MDIHDIRRANLRKLAATYKNRAAFARAIGRSEQQLYTLIGKNADKGIGGRIVRDVEEKLGLEHGELDLLEAHAPQAATEGVNLNLLADCIVAVEEELQRQNLADIPADKKAQAIVTTYAASVASHAGRPVSADFIVRSLLL